MNIKVEAEDRESITNLNALVKQTNKEKPKPEHLEQLKAAFDAHPWAATSIGNLQRNVFDSVVSTAVGNSALMREAIRRYVTKMKDDLNYEKSSFVEKMLIDEIIMRWVRLQVIEQNHLEATSGKHNMKEGMYHEKRLHLAQKRHLDAIETLAKVRKMVVQTQAKGMQMFKDLVQIKEAQADENKS